MIRILTVALAALSVSGAALAQTLDTARVAQGEVSSTPAPQLGVRIFKGLPYAQPPVGPLRWRAPEPASAWTGVRPGDKFPHSCMQQPTHIPALPGKVDGSYRFLTVDADGYSEDCLYLNVWTPAKTPAAHLPVMVYIHGGGFTGGSGDTIMQEPSRLAAKGLVIVTLNYRLGAFGFLAHPELTAEGGGSSGDYGMLDQIAALKWVQQNIGAFGGDPSKVTIFGGSAGSMSVSLLTASPLAKGLFQRAIAESGTAFGGRSMFLMQPDAEQLGAKLFADLGAKNLAEARAVSAQDLLAAQVKGYAGGRPSFGNAFMPKSAAEIYAAGQQNDVAFIVGWNAHEDTILSPSLPGGGTAAGFTAYVQKRFGADAPAVLAAYPANTDEQARLSAGLFFSDSAFGAGAIQWAVANAKTGRKPGYVYHFTHPAPIPATVSMFGKPGPAMLAHHGGEMYYVNNDLDDLSYPWTATDRALAHTMQGYWVNFAKTGDPNGPGLPRWDPVAARGAPQLMLLDDQPHMTPTPRLDGMAHLADAPH
jgi:para-nitrobenzyl esterase